MFGKLIIKKSLMVKGTSFEVRNPNTTAYYICDVKASLSFPKPVS